MAKRALIIIDLQNDYFPGGNFELVGIDSAAANAVRLLQAARSAGETVIHVRHESGRPGAAFFVPGTSGAEIHASVRTEAGEAVITKTRINAFLGTELKALLDGQGITDVTIAGAMSHMCVDAATRAAADVGLNVTVVQDAVATRDLTFDGVTVPAAQVHAAFMAALAFAYAKVVPTSIYLEQAPQ